MSALRCIAGGVLAAALVALCAPAAHAQPGFGQNPILFVHGIEGSGAQFESQALRFTSNGYPANWIDEVDYNSSRAAGDESEVDAQIDQAIADLKKRTGRPKVDVVAHSLGTIVMYDYMTRGPTADQRKATIGRYVNVDGQNQNPGVPTLALWSGFGIGRPPGGGPPMPGATNVTIPDQTHVQTNTSHESFVEEYKFLTGGPAAHDIVAESGPIQIAGKALNFPQNTGLAGASLQVWPVGADGRRTATSPVAAISITDGSEGGGAWGPITVQPGQRYEFALAQAGTPTLHTYYEPFVRSDHALRLLSSAPIQTYVGYRPGTLSAVNLRYKELWGDRGAESDQLLINGLNVCNAVLCPLSQQVNGLFVFDRNRDGQTDLSMPDPVLNTLPFLSGGDVFIPAATPPAGTTSFQLRSRGAGPLRTLNVPDWESMSDGVILQWNDFEPSEVEPVAAAQAPPTPVITPCPRRLSFVFHLHAPRGERIVRATAFVGGRVVRRMHGHRVTLVRLRKPTGKTSFTVRIVTLSNRGTRTVSVRRYTRCHKTAPTTHRHRSRG